MQYFIIKINLVYLKFTLTILKIFFFSIILLHGLANISVAGMELGHKYFAANQRHSFSVAFVPWSRKGDKGSIIILKIKCYIVA